jgi:hypothetical protein
MRRQLWIANGFPEVYLSISVLLIILKRVYELSRSRSTESPGRRDDRSAMDRAFGGFSGR